MPNKSRRVAVKQAQALSGLGPGPGWAVELAESRRPTLKLRQSNNINPTAHGTYLTACVLYAYLTWQSPVGLNNGGLFVVQSDEMRFLQGIAWEIFQWRKTGLPF